MQAILRSRILLCILGIFLAIGTTSVLLFSPIGNSLVANSIIKVLESKTKIDWRVRDFKLSPDSFSLDFSAQNEKLEFFAKGDYSLLTQSIQGDFLLNSKGLTLPIQNSQENLNIPENAWIEGVFSGEFSNYFIQAKSNILQSQSDLNIALSYLTPQSINLSTKDASLAKIFEAFDIPPYSDGILSIDLQLNRHLTQNTFNGNISLNIDGGDLDREIFLRAFRLNIDPTHFIAKFQGIIVQNTLEYVFNLYSNVGDMSLNGTTNIQSLSTNTDFDIKFQSLSPLSPLFKIPLNGSFITKGTARGDVKNMLIQGKISLENSPLDFRLSLQELKPHTFELNSKNLQAMALLKLLNQPAYLNGSLSLKALLRDFTQGISGIIQMQGENLFINSPLLETHTKIGFPSAPFNLDSKIELAQGRGVVDYTLASNTIHLQSQSGNITLKPFSLNLPQNISVSRLQNLSYNNKSLLNGNLTLNGTLTQNSIELSGAITQENIESKTSFKVNSSRINFYLSNLNQKQIHTIFPKIPSSLVSFEGRVNLNYQHDFLEKIKHINFDILTLKFHQGTLLNKLNRASCANMNKTTFSGHFYNQLQSDNTLSSAIALQNASKDNSQLQHIRSSKVTTNLNTQEINGNLTIKCAKTTKEAHLNGTIKNLKIKKSI